MTLLFKCDHTDLEPWLAAFARQMPGRNVRVFPEVEPHDDIDYALVYAPPTGLLAGLPNLKVIFSLWAGVEHLLQDRELPPLPVVRMVDRGMEASMVEHVLLQVLAFHRQGREYREQQAEHRWQPIDITPPWERRVGLLGLGALGCAAAGKLVALGFDVAGWSRTAKQIPDIACYHGADGLGRFLARTEILICLLPLTEATRGILNKTLFDQLPRGAHLINCARGGHLVEADLLAALDDGRLADAALDVFEPEPLAEDHPFWDHPRIVVTPHVAAFSPTDTAIEWVAANIARIEAGEPPLATVDFTRGY